MKEGVYIYILISIPRKLRGNLCGNKTKYVQIVHHLKYK